MSQPGSISAQFSFKFWIQLLALFSFHNITIMLDLHLVTSLCTLFAITIVEKHTTL